MDVSKEIYYAGGCFWGVEEYFSRVPGVLDTISGYANSDIKDPSYEYAPAQQGLQRLSVWCMTRPWSHWAY